MKSITVREWINKFINGEFEAGDFDTQTKAGWNDWFCPKRELASRLKKMGNLIKKMITFLIIFSLYFITSVRLIIHCSIKLGLHHSEELLIKILNLYYHLTVLITVINMKYVLQGVIITQNFNVIQLKNFLIT